MKNMEIEFKYMAQEISRSSFDRLVRLLNPVKQLHVGKDTSIDYYFTRKDRFMRFRTSGAAWELTSKVKHSDTNNKVRTETNIPLGDGMTYDKARAFAECVGLEEDFQIKKDVQVYWFDKIVLSHYTCYTLDDKELDTFMEIECNESYQWESEEQALAELAEWERKLAPLGLTPHKRVRRSLFEFYTKIGK